MRYIKKQKTILPKLTIVFDDRERKPWMFLSDRWVMKKKRLKVGDYSIEGFEDQIVIEKKSGLAELFTDLSAAKRPAFERFLRRLSECPIKTMIIEQPLTNSGVYSTLEILRKKSKGKIKLSPSTIFWLTSIVPIQYNIPILFMDKRCVKEVIPMIFKKAYEKAVQQ